MFEKVHIGATVSKNARMVMDNIATCLEYHMENNGGIRPQKLFISRGLLMVLWLAEPNREQMLVALDNKSLRLFNIPVAQFPGEGIEFYFSNERYWIDPEVIG